MHAADRKHSRLKATGLFPLVRLALSLVALCIGAAGLLFAPEAAAQTGGMKVRVVELDRPIDKVTARFIRRAIRAGEEGGAALIIIQINTPGGSLDATRSIVSDIFAATVPVAAYVGPEGAQAASAGTFIAAAAPYVAMAPATNIGAASVVGIQGEDLPETLGKKATEDAAAFLRSIAERRGRPVEPLEATVKVAAAYSAEEAVKNGIADFIAGNVSDVLRQLDGKEAAFSGGKVTLRLTGAELLYSKPTILDRSLGFLADPTVAFLLMSLGGLGVIVELWSPGLIVPGVLGATFLILGFAGLGQLPFSWAGIVLFAMAMALFFAETQHPGIGFFGITGAILLVLSGFFLISGFGQPGVSGPTLRVSLWVLGVMGGLVIAVMVLLIREDRLSRKAGPYVNPYSAQSLIGQTAEVVSPLSPQGQVRAAGEIWSAEVEDGVSVPVGGRVKVKATRDIWLIVEPLVTGDSHQAA